jgi:hypothetical protein
MASKTTAIAYEKSSGNVFADLGLPHPEQKLLKARLTLQIYRTIKALSLPGTPSAREELSAARSGAPSRESENPCSGVLFRSGTTAVRCGHTTTDPAGWQRAVDGAERDGQAARRS